MNSICKITQVGSLGGVCAGLAYTFGMKTWFVRFLIIFFAITFPTYTWITYILLAIMLPNCYKIPEDYYTLCE